MQCRVIKNGSRKEKMSYKKRTPGINTADKRSAGCCCSHSKAHLQERRSCTKDIEIDRPLRVAYHLAKNTENSRWQVNGNVIFQKSQLKINDDAFSVSRLIFLICRFQPHTKLTCALFGFRPLKKCQIWVNWKKFLDIMELVTQGLKLTFS